MPACPHCRTEVSRQATTCPVCGHPLRGSAWDGGGDPYRIHDAGREGEGSRPGAGGAFLKGGCGCIVAFLVIGLLVVAVGGSMHIDIGGAILLFVIGGIIGLIVLAIYNKGRRDRDR